MLSNAYFLAKFRFDTAEYEPAKNLKILNLKFANFADPNPLRRQRGRPPAPGFSGRADPRYELRREPSLTRASAVG